MREDWTPAADSITPTDESFFSDAAFVLPATIELPHSRAQIWEALTDDRLGAWMPIVDRARWIDPPPRSRGARRTIRLLRCVTIDEEFHIWVPHPPGGGAVPAWPARHRHRPAQPRPSRPHP